MSILVERPTDTPVVATVLRGMKTFTVTCYDDRTETNTAHTIIVIIIIIIIIIHSNWNNDCNGKENDCREKTTYWREKKSNGKNN